ncbi:MAG: ATP cone domain-containing protein [Candidatus Latescibacterota bacterium]
MATIIDGKKRIPFMRGMLVHYLIERGFPHEEARAIANATREALDSQKSIRRKEMVRLITGLIGSRGAGADAGSLVFWERLPAGITVERASGARPFSRELLSHSVQAAGLPTNRAYQVAAQIESQLISRRARRVSHEELEQLVAARLREQHGESYAECYRVWRVRSALNRPLIILIGGATGVGKTSLAIALANLLDIPRVVATDDIRQVMRLMLSPELVPTLHPSSYSAGEVVGGFAANGDDPVVIGYREQARIVNVGVRAIIDRCVEENTSVIIDGVHLLPDLLNREAWRRTAFIIAICLSLSDRQAYEARFAARSAQAPRRPVHQYLAHLDQILKIQEHVVESSTAHDIPVLETSSVDDLVSAAAMVVAERLQDHPDVQRAMSPGRRRKGR